MKRFLMLAVIAQAVWLMSPMVVQAQDPDTPPDVPVDPPLYTPEGQTIEVIQEAVQQITMETTRTTTVVNFINYFVNRVGRWQSIPTVPTLPPVTPPSAPLPGPTAGDLVKDLQLSVDSSYARVKHDNMDSRGWDAQGSMFVNGTVASLFKLGLGAGYDHYDVHGGTDISQDVESLDLFVSYELIQNLALGLFFDYSYFDNDVDTTIAGLPVTMSDFGSVLGSGVLASYIYDAKVCNIGLTTSLASMNKRNLGDLFKEEDTTWMTMLDLRRSLTEKLTADLTVSYFYLLDKTESSPADTSFWSVGAALGYQISQNWDMEVGYSHMLAYKDFHEDRGRVSVTYTF